jgi:hypothetical protein
MPTARPAGPRLHGVYFGVYTWGASTNSSAISRKVPAITIPLILVHYIANGAGGMTSYQGLFDPWEVGI